MPLVDVDVQAGPTILPADVRNFLEEAQRRVDHFQREQHLPGFVPCDFARTYATLRQVSACGLAAGNLFCEWGSGFGVVTCLAAMVDFVALGIEVERQLLEEARQLAVDFQLPVQFVHSSFLNRADEAALGTDAEFAWLRIGAGPMPEALDLQPADFDVVFAYPWPDEELLIDMLFDRHAQAGALLITYHEDGEVRVRRKIRRRATATKKASRRV
jgi:hypothetical protein